MAVDIYNLSELVSSIFVFMLSIFLIFKIGKSLKLNENEIILIFCWHSFFAFFFMINDLFNGHDGSGWYNRAYIRKNFYFGNDFMYSFSSVLQSLKVKYVAQNLMYNLLGTFTTFIFYTKIKELCRYKSNKKFFFISSVLVFLPGLMFWSSGISKDSITIFAFALLYYSVNSKFNIYFFLFSLVLIILARPFLVPFFFAGLYLYYFLKLFFDKKTKYQKKIAQGIIMVLMLYPMVVMSNLGLLYLSKTRGIWQFDLATIYSLVTNYIQSSKTFYDTTNLGIPADTIFWKRYLYFLYMPLIITKVSPTNMYFSLENLFFLFVTIIIIIKFRFSLKEINTLTLSYYLSILVLFLFIPLIFSNYGIALRYKWLIIPYFLLAFLDLRKKIK
jgi:hypothetical protein